MSKWNFNLFCARKVTWLKLDFCKMHFFFLIYHHPGYLSRNESGRFGALKSDSTHHFLRNACTKSGSLRFSQFSGCWLILSVYILMSFDFPFVSHSPSSLGQQSLGKHVVSLGHIIPIPSHRIFALAL
jgi:hypothetical protein